MSDFEKEAHRIAYKRRLQNEKQKKIQQVEEARVHQAQWENAVCQMREEISQVLRLIADRGLNHTNVEEVSCYVRGLFGSRRTVKAGWRFSSWEFSHYDSSKSAPVYLLSDGRICAENDRVWSLEEAESMGVTLLPRYGHYDRSLKYLLSDLRKFHKELDPNYQPPNE